MWCGAKFSNALLGCVVPTVYSNVPNRATRDICIRSCAKAPLKKCEANTVSSAVSIPGYREHNSALPGCDARTVSSVASIPGHQR